MNKNNIIELEKVHFEVENKKILTDINISIGAQELVSVVGANGGGKSTLIKLIIGEKKATSGVVKKDPKLKIGYQPQQININPNVPLTTRDFFDLTAKNKSSKDYENILAELQLKKEVLEQQILNLSGGQRQLVNIARAFLCEANLLIFDEPGTYCDQRRLSVLYKSIETMTKELNCTTICVSHDISRVLLHSDRIFCIDKQIICQGGPKDIVRDTEFENLFHEEAYTGLFTHKDHYHS